MDNRRNYYRILHVQFDAPEAVIRASYRTIMQKLRQHPDLGGDQWNATVINQAYAVLSDPMRRAAYDKTFLAEHGKQDPVQHGKQDPVQHKTDPSSGSERQKAASASDPDGSTKKAQPETNKSEAQGKDARRSMGRCPFCHHANAPTADECSRCYSPLTIAPEVSVAISARRHIERIPVRERATFYDHWPQKVAYNGEVRDLSPKGCQVITVRAMPRGRRIKIDTPLFSAIGTIQASRSRAAESGTLYVLAVKFATLRFTRPEGSFVSVKA